MTAIKEKAQQQRPFSAEQRNGSALACCTGKKKKKKLKNVNEGLGNGHIVRGKQLCEHQHMPDRTQPGSDLPGEERHIGHKKTAERGLGGEDK